VCMIPALPNRLQNTESTLLLDHGGPVLIPEYGDCLNLDTSDFH
jgi:hypothetical protein